MEKTITVKGTGKIKQAPDLIQLTLELLTLDQDYTKAYKTAGGKIERLTESIKTLGFQAADLKTSFFDTHRTVEQRQVEGQWQEVFLGYEIQQRLLLEFDLDQDLLLTLMEKIVDSKIDAAIEVNFTLKDQEAAQAKMLADAAADARAKAEVLANAVKADLGTLLSITYDWGTPDFRSEIHFQPLRDRKAMAAGMPLINPVDVETADHATFVWTLK